MSIRCKCCQKVLRGNAAWERYDEDRQEMVYFCKPCHYILSGEALKLDQEAK